jgi:cobalt-zinc-cadmium efflux system outer membrane protein
VPAHSRPLFASLAIVALACATPPDGRARVETSLAERTGLQLGAETAGDALSEDRLVALALRNSPHFRAALADLGISAAEWMRAGALPPITFSVLFPLGEKQLEYAAKLPIDALWLRPKRVVAARRDWEATAERVVQHGLDLVRDVRVACADASAAARVERAWQSPEGAAFRAHAEYAARRFHAGGIAAEQVAQAELRAAAASDRRASDAATLAIAGARLAELTLADPQRTDCFAGAPAELPAQLPPPDALVTEALAARPDLRAAEIAVEAAGERAGLAPRELLQLIAVFDANGSGRSFEAGPGVELQLPLDAGRPARALADAKLARAGASYEAAVQRVTREVREAHARAASAASAARQWRGERLPALAAWRARAEAARRNGAADAGAVLEAQIAELEGARASALADAAWRRARAELERAVGRQLVLDAPAPAAPAATSSTNLESGTP